MLMMIRNNKSLKRMRRTLMNSTKASKLSLNQESKWMKPQKVASSSSTLSSVTTKRLVLICWYQSKSSLNLCRLIPSSNLNRSKKWWYRCKSLNNGLLAISRLKLMRSKRKLMITISKSWTILRIWATLWRCLITSRNWEVTWSKTSTRRMWI